MSPVDLDTETKLDAELRGWLAFATQKLTEISALADAANGKRDGDLFPGERPGRRFARHLARASMIRRSSSGWRR